jgi:hypothetical protein
MHKKCPDYISSIGQTKLLSDLVTELYPKSIYTRTMNKTITKSTTKQSLFLIGEHFHALESLLEENGGEITEEIDQWLTEYQAKQDDKIDAYCYLIQKFEEIAEESKRLADRSSSYYKKAKSLKDRLKLYLESKGTQKIETPRFTVSVCGNGGLQPVKLHEGIQPETLPDDYTRTFTEPDMDAIRQALLDGDVEATKVAQLLPRGTHLRIT